MAWSWEAPPFLDVFLFHVLLVKTAGVLDGGGAGHVGNGFAADAGATDAGESIREDGDAFWRNNFSASDAGAFFNGHGKMSP